MSHARIAVYVCHCGGNISEIVDVEKVASIVGKHPDVVIARSDEHMCSDSGRKIIQDDIKEYKVNRIVVAACSPQFHEKTFRRTLSEAGVNPYTLEIANLREQCSWVHFNNPEAATRKAIDLVNMAIAKVRLNEPLELKSVPIENRVLVIGGGIAGIQSSLDLGDAGFKVYLVEEQPTIGGRMSQLSRTFPTEDCSACILAPKMADVQSNPNIKLLVYSEIKNIEGYIGNFKVVAERKARYVNAEKCTNCGICEIKCPINVPDEFNQGLTSRKAIYIPHEFAVPSKHLIDEKACLHFTRGVCGICEKLCRAKAIEFDQKPQIVEFMVDTVIVATGCDPYGAKSKEMYGYGVYRNVITSLELERIVVHATQGKEIKEIGKKIAFIQCVGSRDEQIDRLYCSRVCCMYAVKLAQLLKRQNPERDVYIFYVDMRAYGKGFEEYYKRAQEIGVKFVRGRVAEVSENLKTGKLTLRAENTLSHQILELEFDLVVLSIGLVPSVGTDKIAEVLKLAKSPDGFLQEAHPKYRPVDTFVEGIFICGCAQSPKDIPDTVAQAGAASSRAIRLMNRREIMIEPIKCFVDAMLCDGCNLCVTRCPAGAITVHRIAEINEALCYGCGACVGYCPKNALDLKHYTDKQILAEIKAALANKKDYETRMLIFSDYTCTYQVADAVGTNRMAYPSDTRIIRLPSGSRVTPKIMLEAFKLGADGIFIGECEQKTTPYPKSVDYIKENINTVKDILYRNGVEAERVCFTEFVTVMLSRFVTDLNKLASFMKKTGPIPPEKRETLTRALKEMLTY